MTSMERDKVQFKTTWYHLILSLLFQGDGIDREKIEEHMNHALSLAPNRIDIYVLYGW